MVARVHIGVREAYRHELSGSCVLGDAGCLVLVSGKAQMRRRTLRASRDMFNSEMLLHGGNRAHVPTLEPRSAAEQPLHGQAGTCSEYMRHTSQARKT